MTQATSGVVFQLGGMAADDLEFKLNVMKKSFSRALWGAGALALVAGSLWYSRGGSTSTSSLPPSGALQIDLSLDDASVASVTATITGKHFETQTHNIKIAKDRAVSTALLGGLPVGSGYTVELEGGRCHGSSKFKVEADRVANVEVALDCGKRPQTVAAAAVDGPRCGDNIINQPEEQCDGTSLPKNAEPGSTCSFQCKLIRPDSENECVQCTKANCAAQRSALDENISTAGPILECVLGPEWAAGTRAPTKSCANKDLLTCYCGNMPAPDCANAAPSTLPGPCVPEILAGTDCQDSICVAGAFLRKDKSNGKAMRYLQCMQESCYEACFN